MTHQDDSRTPGTRPARLCSGRPGRDSPNLRKHPRGARPPAPRCGSAPLRRRGGGRATPAAPRVRPGAPTGPDAWRNLPVPAQACPVRVPPVHSRHAGRRRSAQACSLCPRRPSPRYRRADSLLTSTRRSRSSRPPDRRPADRSLMRPAVLTSLPRATPSPWAGTRSSSPDVTGRGSPGPMGFPDPRRAPTSVRGSPPGAPSGCRESAGTASPRTGVCDGLRVPAADPFSCRRNRTGVLSVCSSYAHGSIRTTFPESP